MTKTLTSFDVAALVLELQKRIIGARIQNIYQTKNGVFIFKLHQPNQPTLNLLAEAGKRLHLTIYLLEKPLKPPAFCMVLRKHLRNGIIAEIRQHEFERIVVVEVKTKAGMYELVFELFGEGNIILVDSNGIIQQALMYKRMRDRNILRGEPFQHPPSSGKNPLHLDAADFAELKGFSDLEVVRALTKFLSIGGMYAEEILLRVGVDKNKKCEMLSQDDLDGIFRALLEILSPLETESLKPRIVIDEKDEWVDVVSFPLRKYEGFEFKEFGSFNEALDEFYAKRVVEREVSTVEAKAGKDLGREQRILDEQQESLKRAKEEAEHARRIGDTVYAHFSQLQTLLQRIMDEKRGGKSWQNIVSEIEDEKKRGLTPSAYFESLDARKLILKASVDGLVFTLKLLKSIQENAAAFYEFAKKAERKVKGAEKAVEETFKRIEELKRQREAAVEEVGEPVKRRKKAWYEKFRWFYTSEGFLVVGGKDAVTNEILIRKHVEPHDLVFHADIVGAPFVLLKTGGKAPSKASIEEAAQLAASHSRAWKAKFSAVDVYWVNPEQVSKTPPSGEYLQRGAFMIRGKKNYVRKTPLRLAVGVDIETMPLTVIGGPKTSVASKTDVYVEIVPGEFSSSELAHKIRQILRPKAPKNLQEEISKIPIEEIQVFIPFGKGAIVNH